MARYYLTKIAIEGFRGINNEAEPLELKFSSNTVNSIFAVNGTGKSSLFDALNYALSGSIPKLEEMRAQENPKDYYCNRFHTQRKAVIDLEFVSDDGLNEKVLIKVERDNSGTRTVTSASHHPTPELFLSNLHENFTLLDYKTFSRFIEDSPLERGRSFSALLGLASYSDFRQAFQVVSDTRSFNTDFDLKVIATNIRNAELANNQALTTIEDNYNRVTGSEFQDISKISEYKEDVFNAFSGVVLLKPSMATMTSSNIVFDTIKDAIRAAEGGDQRKELEKQIEAITKLEALGSADRDIIKTEKDDISALVTKYEKLLSQTQGDLFQSLYKTTSELYIKEVYTAETVCPLCNSNDLEFSLKDHVTRQLEQYQGVADTLNELKEMNGASLFSKRISQLEQSIPLEITVDKQINAKFISLISSGKISTPDIQKTFDRLDELESLLLEKIANLKASKLNLEIKLPASLVKLTEQVESAKQFFTSLEDYQTNQKKVDDLQKSLAIKNRWKTFIDHCCTTFSEAETILSSAKISSIDSEYKDMFKKIMNVGDVIPDLKRIQDKEDLNVQLDNFHGQQNLSARALLSESYRNALAISVFLAAAVKHIGPPRFVMLDDVTSSFDAGHQFNLMELIRTKLQQPTNPNGLQFIILSHDGLLEKYFDRVGGESDWNHNRLHCASPMGAVHSQRQAPDRLKMNIQNLLAAGQISSAEPLLRQYLEYKLQRIIRKVAIPVSIDFAMKDHAKMVQNCIDSIIDGVDLERRAGSLVLDALQLQNLSTVIVPAIIGNWTSHYATGSTSSFSAPMLQSVIQSIEDLDECFKYDDVSSGSVARRWYRSLSQK